MKCFRAPPKCLKVGFQGSSGPFQGSRAPLSSPVIRTMLLDDDRLQRYLRLTGAQFEDLLAHTQQQLPSPPCWSECKQPYVKEVMLSAWTQHWLDVAARCHLKSLIFSTLFTSLQTRQRFTRDASCCARCSIRAAASWIACHRTIYIDFQCRVAGQFASIVFRPNAP